MNDRKMPDSKGKKEYEDFFSSSKKQDFEDISSGRTDRPAQQPKQEFEDFFTGREDEKLNPLPPFESDFFTEIDEDVFEHFAEDYPTPAPRRDTAPKADMPYSYNYTEDKKAPHRAKNGDEIFEDIDSGKGKMPKDKKPIKHKGLKITFGIIGGLLALLLILGMLGHNQIKKMLGLVDTNPIEKNPYVNEADLKSLPEIQNILLIGTDARAGEDPQKTRSDTMLIITVDRKHEQIKITSILRDMYVDIPGYRKDKINAAHSHGGTQLLIHTLESDFKIKIDGYVMVTFEIFTELIDSLGGVDVEITKKEAKYINSHDHMAQEDLAAFPKKLEAGMQHFNGQQALWYSRIRYLDSDFQRTARQRKVLSALFNRAKSQDISKLIGIAKKILPMLHTSYDAGELLSLSTLAPKLLTYEIVEQQIPAQGAYKSETHRGQDCLVPDMQKNKEILQNFIFEKVEPKETETKKK